MTSTPSSTAADAVPAEFLQEMMNGLLELLRGLLFGERDTVTGWLVVEGWKEQVIRQAVAEAEVLRDTVVGAEQAAEPSEVECMVRRLVRVAQRRGLVQDVVNRWVRLGMEKAEEVEAAPPSPAVPTAQTALAAAPADSEEGVPAAVAAQLPEAAVVAEVSNKGASAWDVQFTWPVGWFEDSGIYKLYTEAQLRAAAATQVAVEMPATGAPAALLQLATLLESGRGLIQAERKEIADALRNLAATPAVPDAREFWAVIAPCGEGVLFDNKRDAEWTHTGTEMLGFPTIGETFRDCYGDEVLELVRVRIADRADRRGGA